MALANVSLTNTFDEWRTVTNQIITYVNDIDDRQLFSVTFGQANTARTHANAAYGQANTGWTHANNAYVQANTARTHANAAYGQANTGWTHANNAYAKANTIGTLGTQSSSSVSITGGSIIGITDLAVADGGTGASTAADARTNLGLGTLATLNSVSASQIDNSTITVGKFAAGAIANAYVNDIVYGGIGSYAFAYFSGTGITEANSSISGSSLYPASFYNSGTLPTDGSSAVTLTRGGTPLSGTWRAMGRNMYQNTSIDSRIILFFRIA